MKSNLFYKTLDHGTKHRGQDNCSDIGPICINVNFIVTFISVLFIVIVITPN